MLRDSNSVEESKEINKEISQLIKNIHKKPYNADTIIGWVTHGKGKYKNKYRTILNAVAHYEQFDNPKNFNFLEDLIYELISLQRKYRIPSDALFDVAVRMRSWKTRQNKDELTDAEIKMCEDRAKVIHKVFDRLSTNRDLPPGMIVALQLFAIGPYPKVGVEEVVKDLLKDATYEKIESIIKRAASDPNKRCKELANVVAYGLSSPMHLSKMEHLLNLSLTEKQIKRAYLIAPLLAYLAYPEFPEEKKEVRLKKEAIVEKTLNKIKKEPIGTLDQETLEIFGNICSYSLSRSESRELLNKIITEGKNDLVYIITPLFMFANHGNKHAKELFKTAIEEIDSRTLGKIETKTLKKMADEISLALTGKDKEVREYAKRIFRKIVSEKNNDLIYFVLPLIETVSYTTEGREHAKELLIEIEKAPSLGKADLDTRKKLAEKMLFALECEGSREYSKKILLKIITEGENDLAEFVEPLISATATEKYESLYNTKGGENFTNLKICFNGPLFDELNENKPAYGLTKVMVENVKKTPELPPDVQNSIGRILDNMICIAARGFLEDMTGPQVKYDVKSGLKYVEFGSIVEDKETEEMSTEFLVIIGKNKASREAVREVCDALGIQRGDTNKNQPPEKFAAEMIKALKNEKSRRQTKEKILNVINNGEFNLVYFIEPLFELFGPNEQINHIAESLLNIIRDKPLENVNGRVRKRLRHTLFYAARKDDAKELVKIFIAKLKNEGINVGKIIINTNYEHPSLKPRRQENGKPRIRVGIIRRR